MSAKRTDNVILALVVLIYVVIPVLWVLFGGDK